MLSTSAAAAADLITKKISKPSSETVTFKSISGSTSAYSAVEPDTAGTGRSPYQP